MQTTSSGWLKVVVDEMGAFSNPILCLDVVLHPSPGWEQPKVASTTSLRNNMCAMCKYFIT